LTQIVNVQAGSSGCFWFVQAGPDRQPSRCDAPLTVTEMGWCHYRCRRLVLDACERISLSWTPA
jgi:hypothetical protein